MYIYHSTIRTIDVHRRPACALEIETKVEGERERSRVGERECARERKSVRERSNQRKKERE